MRKLLYTLLAVSIICSACKKEEEEEEKSNNSSNNTSIAGTWNATSIYFGPNQLVIPGVTYLFYIDPDSSYRHYAYTTFDNSSEDISGEWDQNGSIVNINYDTGEYLQYTIVSITNTIANLDLNFYLDDSGNSIYTSGSATLERL
ncbi:MAG: hypothetical protein CMD16_05255 [Flavobacteriales bacterium]|nr:hypothetical protein [Flavobacteriales bacterium]|tara:strand:- start:27777 stop:28211 length:435 start_codon:yes stop_codon:yes gene_type:complete